MVTLAKWGRVRLARPGMKRDKGVCFWVILVHFGNFGAKFGRYSAKYGEKKFHKQILKFYFEPNPTFCIIIFSYIDQIAAHYCPALSAQFEPMLLAAVPVLLIVESNSCTVFSNSCPLLSSFCSWSSLSCLLLNPTCSLSSPLKSFCSLLCPSCSLEPHLHNAHWRLDTAWR